MQEEVKNVIRLQVAMNKNIILSVDDSVFVRNRLKSTIISIGYGFCGAENGIEALDVLEEISDYVVLIILDWEMPMMNGYEFLIKLKETENLKNIPVIMLSGETNSQSIIKALKAGAVQYITKPFNENLIKENIESFALTI